MSTSIYLHSTSILSSVLHTCLVYQSCPTRCDPMDDSPQGSWDFPGKNTGVCCQFRLKGIFLMQGLNTHLLHLLVLQVDSLLLSHWGGHLGLV